MPKHNSFKPKTNRETWEKIEDIQEGSQLTLEDFNTGEN